jgi:tyrosine decarboxylase/aspartate 1-decarboxylase
MKTWKKLSNQQIKGRISEALNQNKSFFDAPLLGVPASHLDGKVFSQGLPFLNDAPFLKAMIHNPNHIGCHTYGESESFFKGTHELEREVIKMCAEDIFKGAPDQQDGYISSGGTEANIQAVWIYRNFFMQKYVAASKEVGILCSEDSHYSFIKAANLLQVDIETIQVNPMDRTVSDEDLDQAIDQLRQRGVKYFVGVVNMMTTMFGSVDDIDQYVSALERTGQPFKIHVDGAYGGFFYPFSHQNSRMNFEHPHISSITVDAHKMLQAPYGTGIFLARKGLIHYTMTESASYVAGLDLTLIGSRSGANAIAVWMILMTYGPFEWYEKVQTLLLRTQWVCNQLQQMGLTYYRHPWGNIVTIKAGQFDPAIAEKYSLVPNDHHHPNWYKIVVMDHVTIDKLKGFVEEVKKIQTVYA